MKSKIISTIFLLGLCCHSQDSTSVHVMTGTELAIAHADVPKYPAIARNARVTGEVHLHVTVNRGSVIGVKADAGASPMLVSTATENIRTWQFQPGVSGNFDTTYSYELKGEEAFVETNPRIELQRPSLV